MKVLISAYACEPHRGSEPEVGLRTVLAAARDHDVWVLTRANNVGRLQPFLDTHPLGHRIQVIGVDGGPLSLRLKRAGIAGLHIYYEHWQRLAGRAASGLDRAVSFDLVHHATFATYWTPVGVQVLDKPLVWGPVGGGVRVPPGLLTELGAKGVVYEASRLTWQGLGRLRHAARTLRATTEVLVQNRETARRLGTRSFVLLPNATAIDTGSLPRPARRRSGIAVAGRLVPLKGVRLAVRALRHVSGDAVLHVFGDGPERPALRRAASRWGVTSRLRLHGQLPRSELLERIAASEVLLHPALHEESPLVVAEALSLGTPVVCLGHGGAPEVARRWPDAPTIAVRATRPDRTARDLAAALDRQLAHGARVAREATPSFTDELAIAYGRALENRAARGRRP